MGFGCFCHWDLYIRLREVEIAPMTEEESKGLARELEDACGVSLTLSDEQKLVKNAKGNPLEIQQQILCS